MNNQTGVDKVNGVDIAYIRAKNSYNLQKSGMNTVKIYTYSIVRHF